MLKSTNLSLPVETHTSVNKCLKYNVRYLLCYLKSRVPRNRHELTVYAADVRLR